MRKPTAEFSDKDLRSAQATASALLEHLMNELATGKGIHLESILSALGALAGRACQVAALEGFARQELGYAGLSLATVTGTDGSEYYFGDAINRPLTERPYSVWDLVAAEAARLGATLPDMAELFQHNAAMVGQPSYGVPRWAPETFGEAPQTYLPLWDRYLPLIRKSAPKTQLWPVVCGIAVQQLFQKLVGQFDLGVQTRVVMDCAIAMAKLKAQPGA
ncbi:MAG TPA: hypothetical protein VHZ81_01390 [Galbitalea sp.]|jgi:hypothetical protein|nr:hypothetical protein [Galbitalea sp.]